MNNNSEYIPIKHPLRPGLWLDNEKIMFPIWWLNEQAYCEYKIYLQLEKRVIPTKTKMMIDGKQVHDNLDSEFDKIAIPSSFEEIVELSKLEGQNSRKVFLISHKYGIIGRADEIFYQPEKFIVIDDKPSINAWNSDINQVYGYCLALKEKMVEQFKDTRPIIASLRKEGTDNIYWNKIFDDNAENQIIKIINHIHKLISFEVEYKSNNNPSKCKKCNLNNECDRNVLKSR